jgi:hypothetical protein
MGGLSTAEAARAQALVSAAVQQLPPPTAVTDRYSADALNTLRSTDGAFSTVFFRPLGTDTRPDGDVDMRRRAQQTAGIYGEGEQAGRTVFAGLEFLPRDASGNLRPPPAGTPLGLNVKGRVAFEFAPDTLRRATISPADSVDNVPTEYGGIEQLPQVALARVLRDFGFVKDYSSHVQPGNDIERRAAFRNLLAGPDAAAVDAIRHDLANRHPWDREAPFPAFLQAELRAPTLADVQHIYLEPLDPIDRIDPDADASAAQIRALAAQHGIPFTDLRSAGS